MTSETKIFLAKDDTLETVLAHLETVAAEKIVLNIPNNSLIAQSAAHFKTLKKISEQTKKEIFIESVDEHAIDHAEHAGLQATNPVFKMKKIANIVAEHPHHAVRFAADSGDELLSSSANRVAWYFGSFVIVMLAGFGIYQLTISILPKATITFVLKKATVPFEEKIEVSSKASAIDIAGNSIMIPGELFTAKKNIDMKFTASGKQKTENKATGVLTIFNAFSADPQVLVATTRFETPDGKIFRLDDKVIIPGATVSGGKIIPSSVDATVSADQPGETYNVPPISLWRISGFRGTPRYEGFYAKSSQPMSGGFIGETAQYTDDDFVKAKAAIRQSLKDALEGYTRMTLKTNLKLLDDAAVFEINKEEPYVSSEDTAHFNIFAEGQMKHLVFDENILLNALAEKLKKTADPNMRVKKFTITYGTSTNINLEDGKMEFSARGNIVFEADINTADLKSKLLGFDERQFKELVFGLPGLERANISLWPFWVRSIPEQDDKVDIIIE